jgi:hypothetical protein
MIWLLACSGPPVEPPAQDLPSAELVSAVTQALPDCAAYVDDTNRLSYCAVHQVRAVDDVERVDAACSALVPDLETLCRLSWVEPRALGDGYTRDALLSGCGGVGECALFVLDAKPRDDPGAQMRDCQRYTGHRLQVDCSGHAAQRWMIERPTLDAIAVQNTRSTPFPDLMGFHVGTALVCGGHDADCTIAPEGGTPVPAHAKHCELGRTKAQSDAHVCAMQPRVASDAEMGPPMQPRNGPPPQRVDPPR